MPNILVHIAIQSALTKPFAREGNAFPIVLLGCVIPDIPWIFRRLASWSKFDFDPYAVTAYASIQASLFMTLFVAAASALIFKRVTYSFALISAGCALHLMIDATQVKWGNGVRFFAPMNWELVNWGFYWPENLAISVATFAGVVIFFTFARKTGQSSLGLEFNRCRLAIQGMFLVAFLVLPFFFLSEPFENNSHYLQTLRSVETRPGKSIEFDRTSVQMTGENWHVVTIADEHIRLKSFDATGAGVFSIRGRFDSPKSIVVSAWHRHSGFRDLASVIGLSLIIGWFAYAIFRVVRPAVN